MVEREIEGRESEGEGKGGGQMGRGSKAAKA